MNKTQSVFETTEDEEAFNSLLKGIEEKTAFSDLFSKKTPLRNKGVKLASEDIIKSVGELTNDLNLSL